MTCHFRHCTRQTRCNFQLRSPTVLQLLCALRRGQGGSSTGLSTQSSYYPLLPAGTHGPHGRVRRILRNQQQPVCGHRCGVCGPRCASACEPVCGQGNGWAPSAHASGTNLLLSSRPSPKLFPSRAALHRGTLPHPHAGSRSTTSVASIPQHTPTYSNILQHHGAPRTWPRYSNIHAAVRYTAIHAAVHQCAHQRREDERRGGNARL